MKYLCAASACFWVSSAAVSAARALHMAVTASAWAQAALARFARIRSISFLSFSTCTAESLLRTASSALRLATSFDSIAFKSRLKLALAAASKFARLVNACIFAILSPS